MTPSSDIGGDRPTPLELVGVDSTVDPHALLLRDGKGRAFELDLDVATAQQLREAVRNRTVADNPRTTEVSEETPVGPREIQALIRAGKSAEDVADEHGLDLDKVRRFEMPVLMEREHMASRARTTELRKPHGQRTLDDVVTQRLSARGDDLASLEWDSWKRADGRWTIEATWLALAAQIGDDQLASARWVFDPVGRTLVPDDAAARALMDDETRDIPTQSTGRSRKAGGDPYSVAEDADDLTAVVRATTSGDEEEVEPAWTPVLVDGGSPEPSGSKPVGDNLDSNDDDSNDDESDDADSDENAADADTGVEELPTVAAAKPQAPVVMPAAEPELFDEDQSIGDEFDGVDEPVAPPAAKAKAKRGRASVPSWDEILLGTQGPDNR